MQGLLSGGARASRGGGTSCGCSGFLFTRKSRAMRLPTGWPRKQQQVDSIAIADLDGFCHGQAWPALRGRQPKPSQEERWSGLRANQATAVLHPTTKTRVPQGTEERKKGSCVKVLPVADRTRLDRPLPQTSSRKPTRTNAGGARPEKANQTTIARGGNQRSTC